MRRRAMRIKGKALFWGRRLALAAILLLAGLQSAVADSRYAAFVMDVQTGEALIDEDADKSLYPASLTKLMTLYLLFEAAQQGRVNLDDSVVVSAHAARQPATRLGLRAGDIITLRQAANAAAVKSANDAAVVIAEAISGSESDFAQRMTRKARALGMASTTFRNANGLPNGGQKTTARDMATLGRRIFLDFPQHYSIFSREDVVWGGRRLHATNKLVGRYPGADGIKTGYTSASGYNLVASAEQNGRRLVGVVLGGKTARSRDRRMEELLDAGFAMASARPAKSKTRRAEAEPAIIPAALPVAPILAAAAPVLSAEPVSGAPTHGAPRVVRLTQTRAAGPIYAPGSAGAAEGWAAQLGAFPSVGAAHLGLLEARGLISDPAAVNAQGLVSEASGAGGVVYRARLVSLSEATARELCRSLALQGRDCALAPPQTW